MEHSSKYFFNRDCEYFPCHKDTGAAAFNCMFCYCPLYHMKNCGGDFTLTDKGVKNCEGCALPHSPEYYAVIMKKLSET